MRTSFGVNDMTIHRIVEQEAGFTPILEFLPSLSKGLLDENRSWMEPAALDPAGMAVLCFQSYVVKTPHHTILVDACIGNDKSFPHRPSWHRKSDSNWMGALKAAGVTVDDIDFVMCTHLHGDHVGWNTRLENGRWVPTFPNARYLFSRIEQQHWDPGIGDRRTASPGRAAMYDDSVLPVIESGQSMLLDGDYDIDDRLHVEPAPGHTPGHVVLHLGDGAGKALFCGDVCHHPIQVYEPDWNTRFCEHPEQARNTRRRLLEHCAEHAARLFPTHFAAP